MDHIKLEKIKAINNREKHQFFNIIFFYTFLPLAFSLLVFSPFWYPSLCSSVNVFLYVMLPQFFSHIFSTKFLFIIGNLIILVLVGETKIFSSSGKSSPLSDKYYDEYINKSQNAHKYYYDNEDKTERRFDKIDVQSVIERVYAEKEEIILEDEELNKRADDLIARVKKQRRLEAKLLVYAYE